MIFNNLKVNNVKVLGSILNSLMIGNIYIINSNFTSIEGNIL
jgi:hypothetical protein